MLRKSLKRSRYGIRDIKANEQKSLNTLVTEDSAAMEVEIGDEQVEKLKELLGDTIAGHLLQKPNEALIAELLALQ